MQRNDVFLGPHGLRSGWRVFFFALLFAALFFFTSTVWNLVFFHSFAPKQQHAMTPSLVLIGTSASLMAVLLTLFITARAEGVSLFSYGLPAKDAFRSKFWGGLALGFVMLSALMVLLHALHGFYYGAVTGPPAIEAKYGVLYAIGFLMVGFFEELLMRSYLLYTLTRGAGFWIAAVISSIIFAAVHLTNGGEGAMGIFAVFCAGMLFCFFVRRTGNLWFAIGFHASWDWAQTYFYGVADSGLAASGSLFHSHSSGPRWLTGGSVGPEGSYLVFVILAACALLVHFAFPDVQYPTEEMLAQQSASIPQAAELGGAG